MNRERLAQIVVRLYPETGRAERSDELVGTLLDASDDSRLAFARQLGSVVAGGIAARSRVALSGPPGPVAANAVAWAAIMFLVQVLVEMLGFEARSTGVVRFPAGPVLTWGLPIATLALFTLRLTRTSGLVGLAYVGHRLFQHPPAPFHTRPPLLLLVLPLAGFALLALAPKKLPAQDRWLWLIPAGVFALFEVTSIGNQSGFGFIAPLVVALCFLPFKASFALGTALAWSALGAWELARGGTGHWFVISIALLACTPIAVIAISVARRASRRA